MASLELALVLLEERETRRVEEIGGEAFRIFGSQHVHPEAPRSLKVFRDAAAAERLSTELVRKVLVHFKKEGKRPPEEGAPF